MVSDKALFEGTYKKFGLTIQGQSQKGSEGQNFKHCLVTYQTE